MGQRSVDCRRVDRCWSAPRAPREAALQRPGEARDDLFELLVGCDVRWGEKDGVALDAIDVAARGVADEAVFEGALPNRLSERALGGERSARRPLLHELDADEETPAAYIADSLVARECRAQRALEFRARGAHPLEQPVALDDGLHGDSRGARRGVSAEGVTGERAAIGGLEHICDRVREDGGAERQIAPGEALRDCRDVG